MKKSVPGGGVTRLPEGNSRFRYLSSSHMFAHVFLLSLKARQYIGSLSNDVFEQRKSPRSRQFSFLGSGFTQMFWQIVCIWKKTISNTNLVASRHTRREKTSLPVNVRCSKTSLLKSFLRQSKHARALLAWAKGKGTGVNCFSHKRLLKLTGLEGDPYSRDRFSLGISF